MRSGAHIGHRPRRRCCIRAVLGAALLGLGAACDVYDPALLRVSTAQVSDPLCGNGQRDDGELCDVAISPGMPGACPSDCSMTDPCAPRVRTGTGCRVQCTILAVTTARSGDGCCPPGTSAAEDSDCGSCGDGIIGPAETCDPPDQCPTAELCSQADDACITGVFSGDPAQCTARCVLRLTLECMDGDRCCPDACDASSDTDCSAGCGDGVLQAGETCEAESAQAPPCPESCDDGNPCTTDVKAGTPANCNVQCAHLQISEPASGDGCCPPGAHNLNDDDCAPVCGNAVHETGETCDPCPANCDDSDACTSDAASGSAASCSLACSHQPRSASASSDGCCPSGANAVSDPDCSAVCGNAVVEPGEACDGGSLCTAQCTKTDEARCLDADTTSANQTCHQCRCKQCTSLMLGCFTNQDATFAQNCRDVIECGQVHHCYGDACYCGTNSTCTAPNGPCRSVIDAASADEGESAQSCTNDPSCSVYQATAIGQCVSSHCDSQCR